MTRCETCAKFEDAVHQLRDYNNVIVAEGYYAVSVGILKSVVFLESMQSKHKLEKNHEHKIDVSIV